MHRSEYPGQTAAEQAAALLEGAGMQRMSARVLMALVASPDAGYSAAELAARLGVSAAAVSGAVRFLQTMRMIQRITVPGERTVRYDTVDDGWQDMATSKTPMYEKLAEYFDVIAAENVDAPASQRRAHAISSFLRFLSRRMPELVTEWQQEQRES